MESVEILWIALAVLLCCFVVVAVVLLQRASSLLNPLPRDYALSLVEPIYDFLTEEPTSSDGGGFLLRLAPNCRERVALARVVVSLAGAIVECRPERVRALSEAWRLEQVMVWRILHLRGRRRLEALDVLLRLYPHSGSIRRVVCRTFGTPSAALGQLLLVVYASPRRVAECVARHPYTLLWDDVGRIVELLKRGSTRLALPEVQEVGSANVEMLLLYLASVEGVGSAYDLARRYADSTHIPLRRAAMNILLEESLFPSAQQSDFGG